MFLSLSFFLQERFQRSDSRPGEGRSRHFDSGRFVHDLRCPTLRRSASDRRRHGLRDSEEQLHDDERL